MANNDYMTSVPRGKEWKNISYPKRELTLKQIQIELNKKKRINHDNKR
jgi:hypothetical protein